MRQVEVGGAKWTACVIRALEWLAPPVCTKQGGVKKFRGGV
jgi:hypothetical protein